MYEGGGAIDIPCMKAKVAPCGRDIYLSTLKWRHNPSKSKKNTWARPAGQQRTAELGTAAAFGVIATAIGPRTTAMQPLPPASRGWPIEGGSHGNHAATTRYSEDQEVEHQQRRDQGEGHGVRS